jgi:hypothetical protein
MRALSIATLFFAIPVAAADPKPEPATRGNEVIVIHDHLPVKVPAKPLHYSHNRIAPYSEKAILSDAWVRAWMLLDVDATGTVRRFKFLDRPGYDLDPIATSEVFKQHFDPALDGNGNTMASEIIWGIEWPAHGWVSYFNQGQTTNLPPEQGSPLHPAADQVPCRGHEALHMDSKYPVYRDCSLPNVKAIATETWISRPPAP